MGRQKGQSQRTKGNVRPSSSSRAATLLAENQRFVGFDSMSGDLGYVPMLKSLEDDKEAIHIDPDFRVALNKMVKKDVTTKTKALTEFSQLCQNKSVEDIIAILPYWPRIYNKLCEDSDRKVREFCQIAFTNLVVAVNKEIAPHLKSIIGCWWMAQSDSHAPTSSAALKAFRAAFPSVVKQKKALLFCQQEILQSISNIIFATHATSADLNDAMEKERKQSMALNAFASFLKTFDAEEIAKVSSESVESICLNPKFWKIAKLKSPVIRAAFYSTVSTFCSRIPDLITSQLTAMAKCVLHKLDESNPLVSKNIWEAANNLTKSFELWHEHIDVRKGFLPQLWSLIKNGFYGNAKIIGPYLPSVIEHFSSSIAVLPVYEELFKCFNVCFQSDRVLKSPIETKSVISTIIQCMDVIFTQAIALSTTDTTDIINLIWTGHLFPLLKLSFLDKQQTFLSSLHNAFGQCLNSWSVNALKSEYKDCYINICAVIWKDLIEIGKDTVSKNVGHIDSKSSFLAYLNLLMAIHKAALVTKAEIKLPTTKNVKFSEYTTDEIGGNFHGKCSTNLKLKTSLLHDGLELCVKECIYHVLQCELNASWLAFVLSSFLKEFASPSLFTLFSEPPLEKDVDCALIFLEQSILPWVRSSTFSEVSKEQCLNIASVIYHVATTCKSSIFDIFKNVYSEFSDNNSGRICLFLSRFLINDDREFVTSEYTWFLNFFVQIVRDLGSDQSSNIKAEKWQILRLAFSKKTKLKAEGALVVLESLNEFLDQNLSLNNVIEVNKIYAASFATYADCELIMNVEKANFRPALFGLIKFLCIDPQETLVESLKNTISTMLKTCYYCDSAQTKEFVSNICSECASFITLLLFEQALDLPTFKGFNQAIVVIAEELVMHHMRQSFIVEWLNALLPDSEQWSFLRPSFDSEVWSDCSSLQNEFGTKNAREIVTDSYFSTVQAYASVAVELTIIFSEAYSNIAQHLRYQSLIVETIFARAIAPPDVASNFSSLFKSEFYSAVLLQFLPNAVNIGNGWLIGFIQFIQSVSLEHWDDNFFMTTIFRDDPPLTASLAQVLTVFIEKSSSLPHLMTITQWSLRKFLDNHIDFVENVEGAELTTEALAVLVVLLRKIYSLQGNQQLNLEGDESSLPVHAQLFEKVIEWKSSCPSLFLFDADLLETSDKQLRLNSTIVKFLCCVVDIYSFNIAADQWDFIECSCVSWMESCCSLKEHGSASYPVALEFLRSVCNLMLSLESFVTSPAALSDPTLPSSLNSEWNEFFKPAAHSSLILVYKAIRDGKNAYFQRLLPVIGKCFSSVTSATLLSCSASFETHLMPGSSLPNEIQTLLYHFCSSLYPEKATEISTNQTIAFLLINKLLDQIFAEDRQLEPPKHLLQVLDKISPEVTAYIDSLDSKDDQKLVKFLSKKVDDDDDDADDDDMMENVQEDQNSKIEDIDPDNAYFYAFLLVWKLVINLIKHCPSQKKSEYVAALVNYHPSVNIPELLSVVSLLLPDNPHILSSDSDSSKVCMFTEEMNVLGRWSNSVKIQHLICSLYKDVLRNFPVDVRLWFNNLSKNDRANIADYTSRHVTQTICREELDTISKCKPPSGLTIQVRKVAREVVAIYEISDTNFEIAVQLPANFPLSPVQVNTIQRVGVASSQWRYWMLQMTMLLHRQNGNILDALLLWKHKVDKKLDGLEECMICFSIVHGTNARSLPKLQCKTCRKKYHAECLYKWFDTSNQSTCPLCRSPMMFK